MYLIMDKPIHIITETRDKYERRRRDQEKKLSFIIAFLVVIAISILLIYAGYVDKSYTLIGLGVLLIGVVLYFTFIRRWIKSRRRRIPRDKRRRIPRDKRRNKGNVRAQKRRWKARRRRRR